jgi:hypothetical protein
VVHRPAAEHARLHDRAHHTRRREVVGHRAPAALLANVSPGLRLLYREYERGGSLVPPVRPGGRPLLVSDSRVAVVIRAAFPPAIDAYVPRLQAAGLRVTRSLATHGAVEGMLPIARLPAAARLAARVWPAHPPISR